MRTYWFKRLSDQTYFAVDGEEAAACIYERKDFRYKFEYVGWSDQKVFNQIVRQKPQMSVKEKEALFEKGDQLDPERVGLIKKGTIEQLKVAISNIDKTPPHSKAVKIIQNPGVNLDESMLTGMLARL